MPGMKEIKSRIKSVQSTRQITNAMEIVSTTKFKRYSKLVAESRPYEESMRKILGNIASGVKNEGHPLFDGRKEVKSIAIIVITSDRGLCGSFNSSTLKELEKLIEKNKNKNISIIPFGRKAIDFVSKRNYDFSESFSKISPDEMNKIAGEISEEVVEKYNNRIYDDIFEPSTEYILSALLPRFINLQIYQAILNNTASEHSARKNSMSSATDNADEMIKTLNIKYNRNRQSAITQEITEIVGGASAL